MKCDEIGHVQLPVSDTSEAVAWYRDHLGFQCEIEREDLAVVSLASGPSIFLWQTRDGSVATFTRDGKPWPTIGIKCTDIHALKASLTQGGVMIDSFQDLGCGWALKCFDPFGNMLVICE